MYFKKLSYNMFTIIVQSPIRYDDADDYFNWLLLKLAINF